MNLPVLSYVFSNGQAVFFVLSTFSCDLDVIFKLKNATQDFQGLLTIFDTFWKIVCFVRGSAMVTGVVDL